MAEDGKATQFGQPRGADPAKAARRSWSTRDALRRLSAFDIEADPRQAEAQIQQIMDKGLYKGQKGKCSPHEMLAARMLTKAIAQVDASLCERVIENTEGKLWQPNLNADAENLARMSDEELYAERDRLQCIIEGSSDTGGDSPAQAGDGSDTQQAERLPDPDSPPGV